MTTTTRSGLKMPSLREELETLTQRINSYTRLDVVDLSFETGQKIEVYVAMDKETRSQGLKGFRELDVDGMLFYFEEPSSAPFTMEGMEMDLDIAWFDQRGRLIDHGTYEKDHKYPILCAEQFSYVLECQANTFHGASLHIKDSDGQG